MTEIKLHVAESFRPAFRFALLQQIPFVILCLLMLDFGWLAKLCGIAMLGFWIVAFTIMARRPMLPTQSYIVFIRWGFFPIVAATCLLALRLVR